MRRMVLALACLLAAGSAAAEMEKPAAVNGVGYAIVSGLFDGSMGSSSFIRLINAGATATTFTVLVINTTNAITVGSAAITVPAYAAPQYPLTGNGSSIFTLAGVAPQTNASYALYIQDSDVGAGYAHVSYNGASTLFENQSVCATPLNQRLTSVGRQVLANVHTTALAGNNYPSVIGIHNYSAAAVSVNLAVYDGATGTSIGSVVQTIAANGTLTMAESQLESLLGFTPTSSQLHLNIVVTHTSGAAAPVTLTQTIRNVQLGGEINMGQVCAVNAVSATVTTPVPVSTTPVPYCGTVRFSAYPYSLLTIGFTATVSSAGRLRGTTYGEYDGTTVGQNMSGTVSGGKLTFDDMDSGEIVNVTVQNGVMSGTIFSPTTGSATVSASTNACN
ncbi:MAG: hypothetical protein K1X51_13425 [Rhodospirillaceae bacterium]|nr:hypothetical protein [Rhodospirillaceae bacterium]